MDRASTTPNEQTNVETLEQLAVASGCQYLASLGTHTPSVEFVSRFPISFSRRFVVLGLAGNSDANVLTVAMGDLNSWRALDTISRSLGVPVEPVVVERASLLAAINAAYEQRQGETQKVIASMTSEEAIQELRQSHSRDDLLDTSDRSPVVKLVNSVIAEAVTASASDIHVQPYSEEVKIRFRIDGILHDIHDVPKYHQEEVLSRVKVLGGMNIAEKRLPQDGRATVEVGDRIVDLRIASMPTSYGERIVIRILDKTARLYTLKELGMSATNLQQFRKLIHFEHGMVLVTGPTGSGKSTTLYSALGDLNTKDRNVITLEDPIEYQLEGISQTQINTKKGLTFAEGLRSVLRQDPDIIMVGEIRDQETAVMAIQSALTGHLVFSTLHTNDSTSAISRLLDLGIEPFLIASSLLGVLAQRLVRQICSDCSTEYHPTSHELDQLGMQLNEVDQQIAIGTGCPQCRDTGYRGRFAISELLMVNDSIREQIQQQSNATQIQRVAQTEGMKIMRDDGIQKILSGLTTLEEVLRVTIST